MRLVRLSTVSILGCVLGLIVLLAISAATVTHMLGKQDELARLLQLQERIDAFSVASDSLMLFGADPALREAFLGEARALQNRLGELGPGEPRARVAADTVALIARTVRANTQATLAGPGAQPVDGVPSGARGLSPRAQLLLNQVAGHGIALDTLIGGILRDRRTAIAAQINWIVGGFAASAALFGAVCMLAFGLIHRRIGRPVAEFARAVHRMRRGDSNARVPVSGADELSDLAVEFNRLADERSRADREVRERRAELQRRESMLADSQRIARLGSWRFDIAEDRLEWSAETFRVLGYGHDEIRPSVEALFHALVDGDRERVEAQWREACTVEGWHDIEARIQPASGGERVVHLRARTSLDGAGRPARLDGTLQDVTALRHTEARLLEYEALVEESVDWCAIVDETYRYRFVNRAYAEACGVSREHMEGMRVEDVLGREWFGVHMRDRLERCLRGEAQVFEISGDESLPDACHRLVRYRPLTSIAGGGAMVGVVSTDVTALRRAQTDLQETSRLLAIAGETARLGGWSADLRKGTLRWSAVVGAIHGLGGADAPGFEDWFERFCHPDDRDRVLNAFEVCARDGRSYQEEFRVQRPDGETVWLRSVAHPVRDAQGRIVRVEGASQDITEAMQAVLELEAANETRRALINSLPAHICLIDPDGGIIDVNAQWREFGARNSPRGLLAHGVGSNYLAVCDSAAREGDQDARVVGDGIRDVIAGLRADFAHEYPCHSSDEKRWFRVMVARLQTGSDEGYLAAVIMHIDITERKLAEQELNRLAYEDRLTRLPSRNGFLRDVEVCLAREGWQPAATVVFLDLDRQRDINEVHGYTVGDSLLVAIGERLLEVAGPGAVVARMGGDEFAVFLPGSINVNEDAALVALERAFAEPFSVAGVAIETTARFGFTRLGNRQRPVAALLREAELALFNARDDNQGAVWNPFTPQMDEATNRRIQITRELRDAINQREFELHFQPKVHLATGRIVACEALIRWRHPERGLQPPGTFIPVAEQSRLIGPIGNWTLDEACRLVRQWRDEGLDAVRVSVNVSLVQFHGGDFRQIVSDALKRHGIPPDSLTLEITESVFERDAELLHEELWALRRLGVRLSLDDFGTGYSSLSFLQQYPFDEIKIDQSFVFRLLEDHYSREIVRTVILIAGAIGAEVVAEGIENAATGEALRELGCRVGQGFYYSMPLEAEDFRWLMQQTPALPLAAGPAGRYRRG